MGAKQIPILTTSEDRWQGEPLATETPGSARMFMRFLGFGILAFEAGERHVHRFGDWTTVYRIVVQGKFRGADQAIWIGKARS